MIKEAMHALVNSEYAYLSHPIDTNGVYVQNFEGVTLFSWSQFPPATLEKWHILMRDGAIRDDFTEARLDRNGNALDPENTTWISDIVDIQADGRFVVSKDFHLAFGIREDGLGMADNAWTGDGNAPDNGGIHSVTLFDWYPRGMRRERE